MYNFDFVKKNSEASVKYITQFFAIGRQEEGDGKRLCVTNLTRLLPACFFVIFT